MRNNLKFYRKRIGLTQFEVAEALGFHHEGRIGKWEKGLSLPSTVNLLKLSVLYEASLTELFPNEYRELQKEISKKLTAIREKYAVL